MNEDPSISNRLLTTLLPSIMLVEGAGSNIYEDACLELDPQSEGSLVRLLDGRKRMHPIEYITPSKKFSEILKLRFCTPHFELGNRSLDNELFQSVASKPPMSQHENPPYIWFTRFRKTLLHSTISWKEFADQTGNTLHQPLTILIAISAEEEDPLSTLRALRTQEYGNLPPTIPKAVLVVTTAKTDQSGIEALLVKIRSEFGQDLVFRMDLESEKHVKLSFDELMNKIIKITQNRIFSLYDTVVSQRKGLTNSFRAFFGGGTSSSNSQHGKQHHPAQHSTTTTGKYPFDSLQVKMRTLADLLFWLKDYESGLQIYTYVRDEYHRDDAYLMIGNSIEMISLCSYLAKSTISVEDGAKRTEFVEKAVDFYNKAAPDITSKSSVTPMTAKDQTKKVQLAHRLATRACLNLLEIAPKNSFTTLKLLMKCLTNEDELCRAILLEQISLLMLETGSSHRGFVRKSNFNLLHAGSLYRSLGLDRHSFRCYFSIHEHFFKKGWFAAEHHLEVNLGNLARNLNDQKQLVNFRGYALERGYEVHNSNQHSLMLKEFVEAIEKSKLENNKKPLRFSLPKILNVSSLKLSWELEDGEDSIWQVLEESLSEVYFKKKPLLPGLMNKKANQGVIKKKVHVQEPLFMDLTVFNPLFCPLIIHQASLISASSDNDDENNKKELAAFDVVKEIRLSPKEKTVIRLSLLPTNVGTIKLQGVKWYLSTNSSSLHFQYDFEPPNHFVIEVMDKAPCFEGNVIQKSTDQFLLELKNVGGKETTQEKPLLIALEEVGSLGWSYVADEYDKAQVVDERGFVLALADTKILRPGESTSLFCKVFKSQLNPHRCAIMYDNGRILRTRIPGNGEDFIGLSCFGHFYITSSNQYILVVEIESHSELFQPIHISALSKGWRIKKLVNSEFQSNVFDTKWSLLFQLEAVKEDEEKQALGTSSSVHLSTVNYVKQIAPITPSDFRLRCKNADQINQERNIARKKYDRERAELEAKGELPISIQDIRRARQRGEHLPQMDMISQNAAGSVEALLESLNLIHIAVDWIAKNVPNRIQRTYCTRIRVDIPTLTVSFRGSMQKKQIRMKKADVFCDTPISIRIKNISKSCTVTDVCLSVGTSVTTTASTNDRFPRPTCWIGPTQRNWIKISPQEYQDVDLTACFFGSGVYMLGPIIVEYKSPEINRITLKDEKFVAVIRENE